MNNLTKIAIITITNSGLNFGNRLQNYALQEVLSHMDVQVETIVSSKLCYNSILLSRIRRQVKKIVKTSGRRRRFQAFQNKYIHEAKRIRYGNRHLERLEQNYDAFVVGSDQVWNPNFHFNSDFELLSFVHPHKRFSYAASFGVDFLPESEKERFRECLSGFQLLSVREESGVEIIEQLIGQKPYLHIDPTMLVNKEQYIQMEVRPHYDVPKNYLLVYFLGNISNEYREQIEAIAKQMQLSVVHLSEWKKSKLYHIGPSEFVYLFHHASYVCTDSFHGGVFSILFEKQFLLFIRQDKEIPMNARIETLVHTFGICSRVVRESNLDGAIKPIDYTVVQNRLAKERRRAIEYLETMIRMW